MAITQVGSATSATGALPTSLTITKPTGVAVGDLLLALITSNEDASTGAPTGWVNILTETQSTPQHFGASWWYKIAVTADVSASNYVFDSDDADAPIVGTIIALRGVDTVSPIAGQASNQLSFNTTTLNAPTYTDTTTVGRSFYSRSVRTTGNNVASFSSATSGQAELADTGVFSGGSVSYSHGIYWATSDFSGGAHSPDPVAITSSQTSGGGNLTAVVMAAFTVRGRVDVTTVNVATGVTTTAYAAGVQTISPGVGAVTAAANDATVSILPVAALASSTVAASGAVRSIPANYASVTAGANAASVSMEADADLAEATANANMPVAYYGAPVVRAYSVPNENRTYIVRR